MKRFGLLLTLLLGSLLPALHAEPAPPNFLFILVDDMPWFGTSVPMDKALPGSSMRFLQMPAMEQLAKEGMTFRNARAAAGMCAPSRCSIQTGMMTAHHLFSGNGGFGGKTDGTVEYDHKKAAQTQPLLVPEPQGNIRFPSTGDVLRKAGYATAHFGKWHIYGGGPEKHGFDESDGETDNKDGNPKDPVTGVKSDTSEDPKGMFSISQKGIDFIERSAKAGKPFFVQLSHYATHARFQARPETLKKYEQNPLFAKIEKPSERRKEILLAAMCEDLDTSIGQVLAKLKELKLADNTYVIFTADNGHRHWNESYDLLRGGKWWLWEGGIRVPLIVRGPGVKPGSATSVNVVGYDFLPTFAELGGATKYVAKEVDGVSFAPVLKGQSVSKEYVNRPLYFHYPHYRVSPPCSAIIQGEMKLLHFYEWPEKNWLYNLAADLGETKDLSGTDPKQAQKMSGKMMERLKAVGAFFPKPNPQASPDAKRYDPSNLQEPGEAGIDGEPEDWQKPGGEKPGRNPRKSP